MSTPVLPLSDSLGAQGTCPGQGRTAGTPTSETDDPNNNNPHATVHAERATHTSPHAGRQGISHAGTRYFTLAPYPTAPRLDGSGRT